MDIIKTTSKKYIHYHSITTMTKNDKNPLNMPKFKTMPLLAGTAYKYYLRGFKAKEIAKQMDLSHRTVQRWVIEYNFAESAIIVPFAQTVIEMQSKGFSYTKIAAKLKCSKTTVYNTIKKSRLIKKDA
jgi:orotate phosphoribosyltransferase-like protein